MPIDYSKYPENWQEIRTQVLNRAENKCEFCGLENYSFVGRVDKKGIAKTVKVVLTIAHLDHDAENHEVELDRLKALCQKCHLNYDRDFKVNNRKNKEKV